MRVPNNIRDCTCFLCIKIPDGTYKANGTGFFLSFQSREDAAVSWTYLVTAKHCVLEGAEARRLYVRMNSKVGDVEHVEVPNRWIYPSDPGSDVAILEFRPDDRFLYGTINFGSSATRERILDNDIGIGNETVTIGLFSSRVGKKRNIPILRSGMISAIPEEPIHDPKTGRIYSAYLIEMLSLGGLSGSPVFVHVPSIQLIQKMRDRFPGGYLFLLGVISGHFDEIPEVDFVDKDKRNRVNLGIATVTPISEVLDTVTNDDELFGSRRSYMKQHRRNVQAARNSERAAPADTPCER